MKKHKNILVLLVFGIVTGLLVSGLLRKRHKMNIVRPTSEITSSISEDDQNNYDTMDDSDNNQKQGSELVIEVSTADDVQLNEEVNQYIVDDSEYMQKLVFKVNQTVTDMSFYVLQHMETGFKVENQLYELSELKAEELFVLGVVFYGDMTIYGVSFQDEQRDIRNFYIYVSGKDGRIMMEEFTF